MRALGVMTALLLVAACSAPASEAESGPASPGPSASAPSPAPNTSTPTPSASAAPPGTCPDEVRDGVQATITAQQRALADGDFATARGFASAGFQQMVDVEDFERIIASGYAFLLDDVTLSFAACEISEGLAQIEVDAGADRRMVYRLIEESEGWRIDGASVVPKAPEIAA